MRLQPDLFNNMVPTTIPISKPSTVNPRAISPENCHWEKVESDGLSITIGIGRTVAGWHSGCGYEYSTGATSGPVFLHPTYTSFEQARQHAITKLIAALSSCQLYSSSPDLGKMLKMAHQIA